VRKAADISTKEARLDAGFFGFASGHDFAGCGKTHVLYQGTTLVGS
jgi:hypothetical protein